jgi:hypothetical protein
MSLHAVEHYLLNKANTLLRGMAHVLPGRTVSVNTDYFPTQVHTCCSLPPPHEDCTSPHCKPQLRSCAS